MSVNDVQHGGNHYKQFKGHEPWDVITAWGLGYLDGTALKYISRWRHKGGIEDIDKAIHFLQKLKEQQEINKVQTNTFNIVTNSPYTSVWKYADSYL